MILSNRANEYYNAAWAVREGNTQRTEIIGILDALGIPRFEPFISCMAELGGIHLSSPVDDVFFYSASVITRAPTLAPRYFTDDSNGWWFQCAESRYPGSIQMWEHGSVHFERKVEHIWAPSVEKIVEAQALWASIGGADELFQVLGVVESEPSERFAARVLGYVDVAATHTAATYIVVDGGVVVLYSENARGPTKKRGMQALFASATCRDKFVSIIGPLTDGIRSSVVPRVRLQR